MNLRLDTQRNLPIRLAWIGFVCAAGISYGPGHAWAGTDPAKTVCNQTNSLTQSQCLAGKLKRLNLQLDQTYQDALLKRPVTALIDSRSSRVQLVASQKTWKSYIHANCIYEAGTDSGSSLDITISDLVCEIGEVEKRIAYLDQTAGGM